MLDSGRVKYISTYFACCLVASIDQIRALTAINAWILCSLKQGIFYTIVRHKDSFKSNKYFKLNFMCIAIVSHSSVRPSLKICLIIS